MIHLKCIRVLLAGVVCILCSCKPGKTKLASTMPVKKEAIKFEENSVTVIVQDKNLRMTALRYALSSLPEIDSLAVIPVDLSIPGTNGKFYMLPVHRGEQYNLVLPGNDQVFINAGTVFFTNFQPGQKYHIVFGKAWFKTEKEEAIIKADEITVNLWPNSKLNVDNYDDDPNIIISLSSGYATITRHGKNWKLPPQSEIWLEKATGKIVTKGIKVDLTSWTVGGFRRFGVDFTCHMREVGRLYNKDIYIGDINTETHPLNFDYRYTSIEQVLNLYNSQSDSMKLELRGDSLIVSGRLKSKSTR